MRLTPLLRATQTRTPSIKFLGKRSLPSHNIHPATPPSEPSPHPESPSHSLPDSFIAYRSKAQQHGPLAGFNRASSNGGTPTSSSTSSSSQGSGKAQGIGAPRGGMGGRSGHELGDVRPGKGEVWDRSELPGRFGRMRWTAEEIEAVEMGGAGVEVGWGGS